MSICIYGNLFYQTLHRYLELLVNYFIFSSILLKMSSVNSHSKMELWTKNKIVLKCSRDIWVQLFKDTFFSHMAFSLMASSKNGIDYIFVPNIPHIFGIEFFVFFQFHIGKPLTSSSHVFTNFESTNFFQKIQVFLRAAKCLFFAIIIISNIRIFLSVLISIENLVKNKTNKTQISEILFAFSEFVEICDEIVPCSDLLWTFEFRYRGPIPLVTVVLC